ncbi:MAG: hypothetical protein J5482_02815 [Oscillospiraceae bacterium]|nr:hypothetical protein [Oscillospiraceae bacterium]
MSWYEDAIKKLKAEKDVKACSREGELMAPYVARALQEFCRQSETFAEKVACGGSFEECMKSVGEKVKNHMLSDLEAYCWAVKYYAQGWDVKFQMEIVEKAAAKAEQADQEAPRKATLIDLTAFL